MKNAKSTTVSFKVSSEFAAKYRAYCEANGLQIGRFTEIALEEVMEDHYFGSKAQQVLSKNDRAPISHDDLQECNDD